MSNPDTRSIEVSYPEPDPGPKWRNEVAQILAEGVLATLEARSGTPARSRRPPTQARHSGAALTSPSASLPNGADADTGVTDDGSEG